MVQDSTAMMMDTTQMNAAMDSLSNAFSSSFDAAMSTPEGQEAAGGIMALLLGIGAGIFIVFAALMVFMIIVMWKINTKAGQPGWACLVPIYNVIVLLRIAGKPWWWLFLLCIPIVGFIMAIIVIHNLSKSFGHGAGFTVGLLLLGIVFYPILAFGSSKYIGPGGVPAGATA